MAVIFGAGYEASNLIQHEDELGIEYFIDNNKDKIGEDFFGYNIKEPQYILNKEYDLVILSSVKYADEMREQLLGMGVDKKKIINIKELKFFENKEEYTESDSPLMDIKIRNHRDFDELHFPDCLNEMEKVFSKMVIRSARKRISYPGKCQVCKKNVGLLIDNQYSGDWLKVNLRERLVCPICNLNNRQRVMIRLVLDEIPTDSNIYVTEQVTPVYQCLKKYYSNLIGSEYMGGGIIGGTINKRGIRHEDLLKLSFQTEEMDCIVSNDVLEHVADVEQALSEIYRVLKKEGIFYATFPMNFDLKATVKRAEMTEEGSIKHLLKPVYHGNPVSEDGSLVFYDYGMDIMELVKKAGFSDAYFIPFYSVPYGNIGVKSLFIFKARK